MTYRIAVVGATGSVGREMLNILAERNFPIGQIEALASRRSVGTEVSFGEKTLKIKDLENYISSRAKRGNMLPQGYRKVDSMSEEIDSKLSEAEQ